ncbi:hypothetical protein [Plastoroseomonas hellenica]|uniref:hypothetical protein n=1 Tax=Plastoroseomonas hellenica TaxID=2687306 RepID=UPI001BA5BE28|nr:hypothetical protein [Plastoroseomonas hellenica]MBR0643869.1 hypothetical protein [Plastoroseomonas hellenica]
MPVIDGHGRPWRQKPDESARYERERGQGGECQRTAEGGNPRWPAPAQAAIDSAPALRCPARRIACLRDMFGHAVIFALLLRDAVGGFARVFGVHGARFQ